MSMNRWPIYPIIIINNSTAIFLYIQLAPSSPRVVIEKIAGNQYRLFVKSMDALNAHVQSKVDTAYFNGTDFTFKDPLSLKINIESFKKVSRSLIASKFFVWSMPFLWYTKTVKDNSRLFPTQCVLSLPLITNNQPDRCPSFDYKTCDITQDMCLFYCFMFSILLLIM